MKIRSLALGTVIAAITLSFTIQRAMADCQDTVVHFGDTNDLASGSVLKRQMTTVFFCEGDKIAIPEMTSVHFIEEQGGRICYRDMACGNLDAWQGYVAVNGTWIWESSMFRFLGGGYEFIKPGNNIVHSFSGFGTRTHRDGGSLSAYIALDFGRVRRYCTEPSPEYCL